MWRYDEDDENQEDHKVDEHRNQTDDRVRHEVVARGAAIVSAELVAAQASEEQLEHRHEYEANRQRELNDCHRQERHSRANPLVLTSMSR